MTNIAKRASEADSEKFLREAFERVHTRLAFDLADAASTVTHDGKRGEVTEADWLRVIRSYLPNRYAVESGIVIDSAGKTSDQIDISYMTSTTPRSCLRESRIATYQPKSFMQSWRRSRQSIRSCWNTRVQRRSPCVGSNAPRRRSFIRTPFTLRKSLLLSCPA